MKTRRSTLTKTTSTLGGDAGVVRSLVEWARAEGLQLTSVTVGAVRVDLVPKLAPSTFTLPDAADGANTYREYGGAALDELMGKGDDDGDDVAVKS